MLMTLEERARQFLNWTVNETDDLETLPPEQAQAAIVAKLAGMFRDAVDARQGPDGARLWGELFIDASGEAHFICHTKDDDFLATKDAIIKFMGLLQQQLDDEKQCPFYRAARARSQGEEKR